MPVTEIPDIATFRGWLESKGPNEIISNYDDYDWERSWSKCCPIATFLRELGHKGVSVGITVWISDDEDHNLPPWCNRFVKAIDRGGSTVLTARQVLAVLNTM